MHVHSDSDIYVSSNTGLFAVIKKAAAFHIVFIEE